MGIGRYATGALCRLALVGWAFVVAPAVAEPTVVLLSFDGVRHDALEDESLDAFSRLAREGARADSLTPVFPSSTFANHVALATGAPADIHGIVGNQFRDAEKGEFDYDNDASFIEAEPLWAAAERQGVRAATFFWVGSETAWRGTAATHRRAPFDGEIGEGEKVDQILSWLDLPAESRPQLILSWWHGADGAGHRNGPGHDETVSMLRGQDRHLARLLAGLDERAVWDELTLIIVSDHGMVAVEETLDVGVVLEDAGIDAFVFHASGLANIHLRRSTDAVAAAQVLDAQPRLSAWRRAALPAHLRYDHPRSGDVVAVAEPGLALWRAYRGLDLLHRAGSPFGRVVGAHGYDPAATRDVHGIFVAKGRGVSPGLRLGPQRTLDVAATVAQLLGIEAPTDSEGSPIELGPRATSVGPDATPDP